MTQKQDRLYWREWGKVTRYCKEHDQEIPDRHELHVQAIGRDKSHKDFNNEDLDKVLAVFRALSEPWNLNAQIRQDNQPRIRLVYRIKKLAPEAYRESVMMARWGHTRLDSLSLSELNQLRYTLTARSHKLRHGEQQPNPEPAMAEADPF